jgi:threonine dehydrogenase-like Zn-dependent dehydrogenase
LAFARRTLGVASALEGEDLVRTVADQFGGELPTLVFDATGSRESMERSFELVGACGRLILVGHTVGVLEFDNPLFHRRELEVLASRNALGTDWATVLDQVSNGTLDPIPWISHRPTLESVVVDLPSLVGDEQLLVKAIVDIGPAPGFGVTS